VVVKSKALTADVDVFVPVVAAIVGSVTELKVIETMLHVGTSNFALDACY